MSIASALVRCLFLFVAIGVVGACGTRERGGRGDDPAGGGEGAGDGEGGGGGGGAVSMTFSKETYCRSMATAACDLTLRCDNETLFDERHGADLAGCRQALMAECQALALPFERAVAAGSMIYFGDKLNDCLNTIKAASCSAAAAAWGLLSCERGGKRVCDRWYFQTALEQSCKEVFQGAVEEAGACYGDWECGSSHWCNTGRCRRETADQTARAGACELRLGRGEPCATKPLGCGAELICAGATQFKKCKPLAVLDEECSLESPAGGGVTRPNCLPPLQCISGAGEGGGFGACKPLAKQLEACGQGRARCEPDSYCDFKSIGAIQGDCQPFKPVDEDCKDDADPRQCGAGLYCFSRGSAPGVIPPRPKPEGRCEAYQPEEGLCVKNHSNCLEGFCPFGAGNFEGFCAPHREIGEPCAASYECAPGADCLPAGGENQCLPLVPPAVNRCLRPDPN